MSWFIISPLVDLFLVLSAIAVRLFISAPKAAIHGKAGSRDRAVLSTI
ncbi:hypothetical protein [Neisseria sicca]|nr:hypothetical protein [Neisseria sicca]